MYLLRKYGLFVIVGSIGIIGIVFLYKDNEKGLEVQSISEKNDAHTVDVLSEHAEEATQEEPIEIAVDIKGAVLNPGVYTVDESARVYDVVELAGGFLKEADEIQINLAERAQDEMFVYVPREGETDVPNVNQQPSSRNGDRVQINQATQSEIETLNGVGPAKAQAILDHIEENGPFTTEEDLLEISGIGEKTFEKFKEQIIVP